MARHTGTYLFSKRQLERMLAGREVKFIRGGLWLSAGMKSKSLAKAKKLKQKIESLKMELKGLQK